MKRVLLPVILSLPLQVVSCSAEDAPPIVATGGGVGTAGTGNPTAGTGNPTAGTGNGTSGAPGVSGSGGAGPSTAGSSSGGSSGGSGGGSTGGGGGMGGMGGAMGGSGGMGGSAPMVSVGKLDGMLVMTPCGDTPASDDCAGAGWIYEGVTSPCVGGKLDTDSVPDKLTFAVTGEAGKRYMATMHFYGIMEPKDYGDNATREAGQMRPNVGANPSNPPGFATMPPNQNYTTSNYNTYEIHTFDQMGAKVGQYFINSDTQEGHYTFAVNYARDIEIVGGGKVKVRIFDNNCRMIKNCSTGGAPCTDKARSIDLAGAMPAPMGLVQPGLGKDKAHSGQWFYIDVKNIVPKP